MSEENEVEYDLMVPLVVCVTQGGPYDDSSFVAGIYYGELRREMLLNDQAEKRVTLEATVPSGLVRQLDLLALEFNYHFNVVEYDDEWSLVYFIP